MLNAIVKGVSTVIRYRVLLKLFRYGLKLGGIGRNRKDAIVDEREGLV